MPVYLLHFDRPYHHARHYMGFAKTKRSMHQRIDAHYAATERDGHHHRLMVVIRAAGISFTLSRVWPRGTRADEKRMKQRGHARRCPICRSERGALKGQP
jgi:hypothetical protein